MHALLLPLAVLLSAPSAAARVFPRKQVGINLGWRFHLGEYTPEAPACPEGAAAGASWTPLDTVECLRGWCGACPGLLPLEEGYASEAACRAACCADRLCGAWQYANETDGRNCWAGPRCEEPSPSSTYTGGSRELQPANTSGPTTPAAAATGLDDSSWEVVDTPHDFVSYGEYVETGDEVSNSQGNLAKNTSWYRKHLKLPSSWQGSHVELYVEGAYSVATYYLNGVLVGTHQNGYTSAIWRLDNVAGAPLRFGGEDNVLAVYIDARMAHCTGWWYEGGGLFRNSYLISSSGVRLPSHGVFASATVPAGGYSYPDLPRHGITAATATVLVHATVEADDSPAGEAVNDVHMTFDVIDSEGKVVATATAPVAINTQPQEVNASLDLKHANVWSVARPYLYTLNTTVTVGGVTADTVNTSFGVRGVAWSAEHGLMLNEQPVKMRGYCNHENYAGVGSAIPERVNLFRLQQMRGIGGNAWRASHNPPSPSLLKLADRLGVLILDENRVFQTRLSYNMRDLVARDRNHPAVIFWCGKRFFVQPILYLSKGMISPRQARDKHRETLKKRRFLQELLQRAWVQRQGSLCSHSAVIGIQNRGRGARRDTCRHG